MRPSQREKTEKALEEVGRILDEGAPDAIQKAALHMATEIAGDARLARHYEAFLGADLSDDELVALSKEFEAAMRQP